MNTFIAITGVIAGYLAGSVPTSVWVGKWFYKKDVREEGSGNAGATNTFRVLGVKAAIPVIIIDILKGYMAVWMMQHYFSAGFSGDARTYWSIASGLAAVAGHAWPLFAAFRGGKGVATLFGVGIALFPISVWVAVIVFIVVLLSTGYVSLGSISGGLAFTISANLIFPVQHPGLIMLSVLATLFILWSHRKNIVRLWKGEENRFGFRNKQ